MKKDRATILRAATLIETDADMWFSIEVNRCPTDRNYGKVEDARMRKEIAEKKFIAERLRKIAGKLYRESLRATDRSAK